LVYRFLGDHQRWLTLEGLIAVCSLVWGLVVLWPTDTFASGTTYDYVVGPEWAWGLIFACAGALRLWAVLRRLHLLRLFGSLFGAFGWGVLGVFFWLGNPASATAPIWLCFAVASVAAYIAGTRCHVTAGHCNGIDTAQLQIMTARIENLTLDSLDGV
jgi:hypothetical protein